MALEGYKSNHNVVYSSKYHVVWTPKYRRSVLVGPIANRCEQVIRQTADKYQAEILALEVMPDQVHLLCEVDPQFGIHRLGQESQGRLLPRSAARVSHFEIAVAHPVDQPLLPEHSGRSAAGGDPTIC